MKITLAQLEPHLTKTLVPVYLISGEELLLKQDAFQLIRKAAKQMGFSERVRLTPDAGFDWDQLYESLYTSSMLAEKQIIELDFSQSTPNKSAGIVLQEYADNPSSSHLLLIDLPKIDDKIVKSGWYKSLEKIGITLPLWPIPREQLPQWIMQRAKRYKLPLNFDGASLITDYVEGNLSAAAQVIEKLYLLRPEKPIDGDLIKQIFSDESRFTIFDFIETALMGDKERTVHILDHLKADGIEPVLLMWSITRELRLLADFLHQINAGQSIDQLLQKHRIFFRRQTAFRRFLSRSTLEKCWRLLSDLATVDQVIKGALPGDSWDSLRLFCLKLV